ncbi:MAG TPA: hypothetical protein VEX13_08440 [Chloroflexia bacterium]|nr:hypothetical protein [Chloroflexia bacterium]
MYHLLFFHMVLQVVHSSANPAELTSAPAYSPAARKDGVSHDLGRLPPGDLYCRTEVWLVALPARLALAQQSEMKRRIAMTLTELAAIASVMGRPGQAAKITGAVEAALSEMGGLMEPIEAFEYNRQLAVARGQIPEQLWPAAQDEGRGNYHLTPDP